MTWSQTAPAYHLRPIRPDDAERLVEFHNHLSPRLVLPALLQVPPNSFPKGSRALHQRRLCRSAGSGSEVDGTLIAVARFDRHEGTHEAEVGIRGSRRLPAPRDRVTAARRAGLGSQRPEGSPPSWPTPSARTSPCWTCSTTPASMFNDTELRDRLPALRNRDDRVIPRSARRPRDETRRISRLPFVERPRCLTSANRGWTNGSERPRRGHISP